VEIVRTALARRTLEHHGEHYDIPFAGDGATGLGKPLKLLLRPLRGSIPIYLAALGPRNVELAAEIGDGWLPIFFSPERAAAVHRPHLEVDAARDALKPQLALYVGGMGSRDANFYNRLACRYGYAAEAARIQDLYLDGRKNDAAAAVPDALVDEVALVGSRERIADRLAAWRESGATSINAQTRQPDALEVLAELLL
jgi:alkanesulfonate monooxygenase SsuD/methylene tetrahydromethanopterin reductase-like flavin-dependent oxidoreductase (luciferase family)